MCIACVLLDNVTIFVYGSGDIVSDSLKGSGHGWESAEIQEWLWAIRQWKPQPAPAAGSSTRPLAVDIGANLAWFSLNAAAAGARVAAFEGEATQRAVLNTTAGQQQQIFSQPPAHSLADQLVRFLKIRHRR